ncbi:MAG: oligopeptidase B, partial [Bacteroidota bacterium]
MTHPIVVIKDTEAFQKRLYKEMKDRLPSNDTSIPQKIGDYYYYTRREEGLNFSIYCRRKEGKSAQEEILLDMNELAQKSPFVNLVQYVL